MGGCLFCGIGLVNAENGLSTGVEHTCGHVCERPIWCVGDEPAFGLMFLWLRPVFTFTLVGWLWYYGSLLEGRHSLPPFAKPLRRLNLSDVHASPGQSGARGGTGWKCSGGKSGLCSERAFFGGAPFNGLSDCCQ